MKLLRQISELRVNPLTHEVQIVGLPSQVEQGLVQAEQLLLVRGESPSSTPAERAMKPFSQAKQKVALKHKTQLVGHAIQLLLSAR